ncbi:MAG: cyanophycinase [Planctomycetota bacterium]|nr:cyanophycinase [Planctomycetota bacterium]
MPEPSRGTLFVVGGAEDKERGKLILRRFRDAAGADNARILVVATASSMPEALLANYESAFNELGVADLRLTYQEQRADAQDPDLIESLRQATGVYFTGGDQLKLVTTLGGTGFASALHDCYRSGLHIGGTSAGASAMSTVMIARGRGRSAPRLASVRLSPGLGILRRVIVDQHFQERDRIGRLMAAVLRNPYMLGFGIDEDTAFIVSPEGRVEVLGKGTLTIVDGADLIGSSIAEVKEHQPIAFAGIKVHVLATGWEFDLGSRTISVPHPHRRQDAPASKLVATTTLSEGDKG